MPIIEGTGKGGGLGVAQTRSAICYYDFAVDGGAVGTIALRGDKIPAGAIVTSALLDVQTAFTSGGAATAALTVESAADVQTAAAVSGAPWSTVSPKRATLTATAAPIKTTALRTPSLVVATAALTAGKCVIAIHYQELGS